MPPLGILIGMTRSPILFAALVLAAGALVILFVEGWEASWKVGGLAAIFGAACLFRYLMMRKPQ